MNEAPIDRIVETIVAACHPRRIVAFGSWARGEAGPDSDLDLCVEMETDLPPVARRKLIHRLFSPRTWSMDVVVYTPAEAERNRDVVGTLLYTVEREGRLLYAAE